MSNLFNTNMTGSEARRRYWKAIEGKSDEEAAEIRKEFDRVDRVILQKEIALGAAGVHCSNGLDTSKR